MGKYLNVNVSHKLQNMVHVLITNDTTAVRVKIRIYIWYKGWYY